MTSPVRVLASGLLVTSLVALCLIWSFVNNIEQQERRSAGRLAPSEKGEDESGELLELVIAVLSAREHDRRRHTARETWAKDVQNAAAGVRLDFVLGKACAVPPQLRLDPLSCEEMPAATHSNGQEELAHEAVDFSCSPNTLDGCRLITSPEPVGVDFELREDAVITHLGVYDHRADGLHGPLTAHIFDSVSGKIIVRQSFRPGDKLERRGKFLYKPVTHFAFPKGFLGSAVAQNFSPEDAAVDLTLTSCASALAGPTTSKLMQLLYKSRRGGKFGDLPPMVETVVQASPRYLAASFVITGHPDSKPPVMPDQRANVKSLYKMTLERTEESLRVERVKYNDIVTVPVADTYRNLPLKLLVYFERLAATTRFRYVLKTDDDCLLNVHAVLESLQSAGRLRRAWWGRFRREWSVERFGKWRELEYSGKVYPPFACGAGSVLSADLVTWLAGNRPDLKVYQGEDVSLGIWLGAIGARLWDDERWYCSRDAYSAGGNRTDYLAIPNLSAEEMRQLWRRDAAGK